MNIVDLNNAINAIESKIDEGWIKKLGSRKLSELEFHDRNRNQNLGEIQNLSQDEYEEMYGNRKYYKTVRRSNNFIENWIYENAKDKVFLDYACGNGSRAIQAAEAGASLSLGFDISNVSVENAKKEAKKRGISNIRFFQADAENTMLPNDSVDLILCSGMLHHLDLSFAFPEMRRILSPGGRILAIEALDINPLIKLYRIFTPKMRTKWEAKHILSLRDLKFSQRFFGLREIRYWHVIGYVAGKFPKLLRPLEVLDNILEKIPLVQRLAWIFTFELYKKSEQ